MTFNPVSLLYSLFYFPVIAIVNQLKCICRIFFLIWRKRKPNENNS